MSINAREELIHFLDTISATFKHMEQITHLYFQDRSIYEPIQDYNTRVKAAIIKTNQTFCLYTDYTHQELDQFLNSINFDYDNGYGEQYVFGTIWLEDGTWLNRFEYDGSEEWSHIECPSLPIRK